MKTLLLILLLSLISDVVLSQNNSRKLFPGFSMTPHISKLYNSELEGVENSGFSYSLEGFINRKISNRFHFRTGLNLQNTSIKQTDNSLQWPVEVENGEYKPSGKGDIIYDVDYFSIGIPIGLKLNLTKESNFFFVTGDIKMNYIVNAKHIFKINEPGSPTAIEGNADNYGIKINYTQLGVRTGFGYDFGFGFRSRLSVGPTMEYYLTDHTKSGYIIHTDFPGGHPAFFGLSISYYKS